MMKTTIIKNIGCGLLLLGTTACADYLDKESFDIITPEQVWQDPKLINGVMVNLYDGLNLEDFNYWYRDAWRLQNASSMSDEAQGSFQKDPLFDNGNATYTYEDALFEQKFSDRYKNILNCNDFIYQLQEATALSDSEKKLLLAESRFLRAMHYFTLVKRYGGVPLIDEPQQYDPNNLEALMVPRNKEVEIYDFIVKECQEADIIIAALGQPNFVKAGMVKEGAVVIDVGTTRVPDSTKKSGFKLTGDVKFDEVAPKCSYITPVPGGVGPMTIVSLMKNTLLAGKKAIYQ